jgi:hypothetical protein
MMQGQLVDGAASSMEETMRKVEGDGNAHLLVLLGSVTPLAGPTTGTDHNPVSTALVFIGSRIE